MSNIARTASHRINQRGKSRGFTLMEVVLSLALTAIVAWLVGSLVQLYFVNQNSGRDRVRQSQLARALLSMIADDIRTTVRYQRFDSSGLSQLISGGGSASGGGASGGSSAVGGIGPGGSAPISGAASVGASSGSGNASASMRTTSQMLPPGLYGSSTSIEIDVSRLPRPDEYVPQGPDTVGGTVTDMPSDIKTVAYYVQALRTDGVRDPLGTESDIRAIASTTVGGATGGLVRRSVDRAVTQYVYELGQTDSLLRTGELLAPEVIAIEFEYFDGQTWLSQWDSSAQGLPLVVRISLAMQLETQAKSNPIEPGTPIASLTKDMLSEYGIEIYTTTTIIPGSQLLIVPQSSQSGDTGMSSMGL